MNSFAGTAANFTSSVEIGISLRNLINKDFMSNSDPMCVVFTTPYLESRWVEYSRTEVIKNDLNPDFTTKINIQYNFEEQQKIKFEVYDVDSDRSNLSDHDFIGFFETTLAQIVSLGCMKQQLRAPKENKPTGEIILVSEELSVCKEEVTMQFSGAKLKKKHWYNAMSPFLVFSKSTEGGGFVVVHKTEYRERTKSPEWKPFCISLLKFSNGDLDRNMKIECLNYKEDGNHVLVGEFYSTARQLQDTKSFELVNPKKSNKKGYKNSGIINVMSFVIAPRSSFIEFLQSGTQLHCTFAIDFTASNGDPSLPESLHYNGNHDNQYIQAIRSVGEIMTEYDSDKLFPVLGFGAKVPPTGRVSHEFFVNGDEQSPYCYGIDGVLQAYQRCLQTIQLFGPTNFAPCINHVAKFAAANRDGKNYFILLIITDGVITDMPQTINAIIEASELPMSIIIVGVGGADFDAMETLDADSILLRNKDKSSSRDIVQFVPFRKYMTASKTSTAKQLLSKEVLREIPEQFLAYMKANNVKPGPPVYSLENLPPDPES